MNEIMDIPERKAILNEIAHKLQATLGKNLISAVAYGSTLCEDFMCLSDFDILIVLHDPTVEALKLLQIVKQFFKEKNICVDINVHALYEMPSFRKEAFWHNNRSLYMRIELQLYGKTIIGENLFTFSEINKKDMRLEAVRVLNSLVYQARKFLINKELRVEERIILMKFCIYAALYALAANQIYPPTKKEAMKLFKEKFPNLPDPSYFLHIKVKTSSNISDADVHKAYDFLVKLDVELFNQFKNI